MISRFIGILTIFCFTSLSVLAEKTPYPTIFSTPPVERFKAAKYPQFEMIDIELHNLVEKRGNHKIDNLFCIAGFKFPDEEKLITVLWENEKKYYLWYGALDESKKESKTLLFSKYLNLKNPVDESVISPGTGGVFKSEAASIVDDCKKYGEEYLISPFTPTHQKNDDDHE